MILHFGWVKKGENLKENNVKKGVLFPTKGESGSGASSQGCSL